MRGPPSVAAFFFFFFSFCGYHIVSSLHAFSCFFTYVRTRLLFGLFTAKEGFYYMLV